MHKKETSHCWQTYPLGSGSGRQVPVQTPMLAEQMLETDLGIIQSSPSLLETVVTIVSVALLNIYHIHDTDKGTQDIRFLWRAEIQHKTEPLEAFLAYFRNKFDSITRTRTSTMLAIVVALFSLTFLRLILQPPPPPAVPDLIKVAGLAKSFEPLIFYSENGIQQVGDLQETGVAVWDLGESVRSTNMTSAPMIVKELDDLSENLKTLAIELTKFFANVDGDVDGLVPIATPSIQFPLTCPTEFSSSWIGPSVNCLKSRHYR